ncbi:hypothetical protein [Microbacterium maritypicum]|uniref:Uncharacterized protein n=1 Tax=Microbacterium maritypicum TaxID=33918 RepID=A0ACD4B898_MICMQ|nr:hypothetical protein [Microbacterium liquefaciens]UTT53743.1 hypothetical protein NMQ05_03960 [Microbacterium liquefaciens]
MNDKSNGDMLAAAIEEHADSIEAVFDKVMVSFAAQWSSGGNAIRAISDVAAWGAVSEHLEAHWFRVVAGAAFLNPALTEPDEDGAATGDLPGMP